MQIKKKLFSSLEKLWLLDLDGTILIHNSHLMGDQNFVTGAKEFLKNIDEKDTVIFLTARSHKYKNLTETFLKEHEIKYEFIIYDMPHGERILINDMKPSGLRTAYSFNLIRDQGFESEQ